MKRKFKKIFTLILIIIDFITLLLLHSGTKLIYEFGGDLFQAHVSNSSYIAVQKIIDNGCDFSEIYTVSKNSNGEIEMISTNVFKVNQIVKDLSTYCFCELDKFIKSGFKVPIGIFSGINLLASLGPKLHIKLIANLSVSCELERCFSSAGINQTRHTLTAIIKTEINVYSIFKKRNYSSNIEILLIDNILVGKVPENYFTAQIVGESVKKG